MGPFRWPKSARSRCSRCGAIAVFLAQHRVFCGYKRQGLGGTSLVACEFDRITDGVKSAFIWETGVCWFTEWVLKEHWKWWMNRISRNSERATGELGEQGPLFSGLNERSLSARWLLTSCLLTAHQLLAGHSPAARWLLFHSFACQWLFYSFARQWLFCSLVTHLLASDSLVIY